MAQEPIFTRKVYADTRYYYVDVHKDKNGLPYVCITEMATDRSPNQDRRGRIFIHGVNLTPVFNAFGEALDMIVEMAGEEAIGYIRESHEG